MVDILQIIGTIIGALGLIAVAFWMAGFASCVGAPNADFGKCLTFLIETSPPVQEARDLQDACNQSQTDCLVKIGETAASNKLEDYAESKR